MTDHERLADRLRGRRGELRLTQAQVAARAGVGESAIRALETGRRDSYRLTTLRAVSEALDWTPDSAERILDGAEPNEAVEAGPAGANLTARVEAMEAVKARVEAMEADLAAMRRTLERVTAGRAVVDDYPVNLDDPDEAELWALESIPAADRWALVEHLRKLNAQRGRDVG